MPQVNANLSIKDDRTAKTANRITDVSMYSNPFSSYTANDAARFSKEIPNHVS